MTCLKMLRKLRGMSQRELANIFGVSQAVISMYEKNTRTLTMTAAFHLGKELKFPQTLLQKEWLPEYEEHLDAKCKEVLGVESKK